MQLDATAPTAARSDALAGLLDQLGVAKTDRTTTGIMVEEEWDHTGQGRRSLGYRAISRLSVRLADPDLTGRLVTKATSDLAAVVHGPSWGGLARQRRAAGSRAAGRRRRPAKG